MYSRYVPDGRGGYQRHGIPESRPESSPPPPPIPSDHPQPTQPQPSRPQFMPSPHQRPRPGNPGRPPPGTDKGFLGGGGLSGLFRRLDTEELLILAILVLALKEDGADRSVIWIAVLLYFLMGGDESYE